MHVDRTRQDLQICVSWGKRQELDGSRMYGDEPSLVSSLFQ